MADKWGIVLVNTNGAETLLPAREDSEAEAYLIALQMREMLPFRVETRRVPAVRWEVFRNGPGRQRVRVGRFPSEEDARGFVRAEKRVRMMLEQAGLTLDWDLTPPEVLYTVEPSMEETSSERVNGRCRMGILPGARRAPLPPDRSENRGG